MSDDRWASSSGAMSSGQAARHDLVPRILNRRVANRFAEGATKYGEDNWRKGLEDDAWITDRFNHAREHLENLVQKFKTYDRGATLDFGDDDLGALGWFVAIMMERDEILRGRNK